MVFPERIFLLSNRLQLSLKFLLFEFEHFSIFFLNFGEVFEEELSTLSRQFSHGFHVDQFVVVKLGTLFGHHFFKSLQLFFEFLEASILLICQLLFDRVDVLQNVLSNLFMRFFKVLIFHLSNLGPDSIF